MKTKALKKRKETEAVLQKCLCLKTHGAVAFHRPRKTVFVLKRLNGGVKSSVVSNFTTKEKFLKKRKKNYKKVLTSKTTTKFKSKSKLKKFKFFSTSKYYSKIIYDRRYKDRVIIL